GPSCTAPGGSSVPPRELLAVAGDSTAVGPFAVQDADDGTADNRWRVVRNRPGAGPGPSGIPSGSERAARTAVPAVLSGLRAWCETSEPLWLSKELGLSPTGGPLRPLTIL